MLWLGSTGRLRNSSGTSSLCTSLYYTLPSMAWWPWLCHRTTTSLPSSPPHSTDSGTSSQDLSSLERYTINNSISFSESMENEVYIYLILFLKKYNRGYQYGGGGTTGHVRSHGPCMVWWSLSSATCRTNWMTPIRQWNSIFETTSDLDTTLLESLRLLLLDSPFSSLPFLASRSRHSIFRGDNHCIFVIVFTV